MSSSDSPPCLAEETAALDCVTKDPTGLCRTNLPACELRSVAFRTQFPAAVNRAYATTQAYHIPGTPEFCSAATDAICANYETAVTENCGGCCATEIEAWQSCMLEKELSVKSKLDPPCTMSSCAVGGGAASNASSSSSSSGMGLMLQIFIPVVVIFGLAAGAYVFYRKRRWRHRDSDVSQLKPGSSAELSACVKDIDDAGGVDESFVKAFVNKMTKKLAKDTHGVDRDGGDVEEGKAVVANSAGNDDDDNDDDSDRRTASFTVDSEDKTIDEKGTCKDRKKKGKKKKKSNNDGAFNAVGMDGNIYYADEGEEVVGRGEANRAYRTKLKDVAADGDERDRSRSQRRDPSSRTSRTSLARDRKRAIETKMKRCEGSCGLSGSSLHSQKSYSSGRVSYGSGISSLGDSGVSDDDLEYDEDREAYELMKRKNDEQLAVIEKLKEENENLQLELTSSRMLGGGDKSGGGGLDGSSKGGGSQHQPYQRRRSSRSKPSMYGGSGHSGRRNSGDSYRSYEDDCEDRRDESKYDISSRPATSDGRSAVAASKKMATADNRSRSKSREPPAHSSSYSSSSSRRNLEGADRPSLSRSKSSREAKTSSSSKSSRRDLSGVDRQASFSRSKSKEKLKSTSSSRSSRRNLGVDQQESISRSESSKKKTASSSSSSRRNVLERQTSSRSQGKPSSRSKSSDRNSSRRGNLERQPSHRRKVERNPSDLLNDHLSKFQDPPAHASSSKTRR